MSSSSAAAGLVASFGAGLAAAFDTGALFGITSYSIACAAVDGPSTSPLNVRVKRLSSSS